MLDILKHFIIRIEKKTPLSAIYLQSTNGWSRQRNDGKMSNHIMCRALQICSYHRCPLGWWQNKGSSSKRVQWRALEAAAWIKLSIMIRATERAPILMTSLVDMVAAAVDKSPLGTIGILAGDPSKHHQIVKSVYV